MKTTIPEKALVALPDFRDPGSPAFKIVAPEEAFVPAFDRSFHFGDSIYEVTRTYEGVLFALDEHLRRLKHSAKLGMYEKSPDSGHIVHMARETCRAFFRKFDNTDVYMRITVSRGLGDLNIDPKYASGPYALVFVKELDQPAKDLYEKGVHFAIVTRRRNAPAALDPAMKSGNYLNNVLAIAEASRLGAQDALMLSLKGFVTEGTTNNFFAVKNGIVLTAPLSVGILAGITREIIFEVCKSAGIELQERLFTEAELGSCAEMFFTSSTKEVVPITTLSGKPVGEGLPGPITKRIHAGLRQTIREYIEAHRSESLFA